MKRAALIVILALLSACASYSYPVKDGGDGVYYAESPPVYTYVGGYYGFSYYGPYSGYWYHPIWYSPVMGPHYSWYRPFTYCGMPYYGPSRYCGTSYYRPSRALAGSNPAGEGKAGEASTPVSKAPPLMPVGLEQMTITSSSSRSSSKNPAFASAGMKSRYSAKSAKSSKSARRSSVDTYHASSSFRASSDSGFSSAPSRSRRTRQATSGSTPHDDH